MSCANCGCGTAGLANVDVGAIGLEQIATVIKSLPEGRTIELLKQLPESTLRQICTTGVNQEIKAYLPWILLGGGALALFLLMK